MAGMREPFRFDVDDLTPTWSVEWEQAAARISAFQHALIEACCQAALVSGIYGVEVKGNSIRLTTDVPFGEIHYRPVDDPGTS